MASLSISDERYLLINLRDGDHAAFEAIYYRYHHQLIGNLLRMLKSHEVVEEVVQDLFLKLWENRLAIDPDKPIKAYLFHIAGNMAKNVLRKAAYDRQMRDQLLPYQEQVYTHIEEALFKRENEELLNRLLDQLPPQRRRVYTLCKLEGKSYKEVSELLNISEGTVNDHIRKANLFFRDIKLNPDMTLLAICCLLPLL